MRKRLTKLGVAVAAVSVMALSLAVPAAQANGGGVGEPTVATDGYRSIASIGNYGLVRNPDGSRTVTYDCLSNATGDAASTTVNCSLQVSGSQVAGGSVTVPGPAAPYPGVVLIAQTGRIRLCYSGSAQFIIPSQTLTNATECTRHNVDVP